VVSNVLLDHVPSGISLRCGGKNEHFVPEKGYKKEIGAKRALYSVTSSGQTMCDVKGLEGTFGGKEQNLKVERIVVQRNVLVRWWWWW